MQVKISEILQLTGRIREINKPELNEIEFLDDDGNVVEINSKFVEHFKFIGLSNCDFITSEFYKTGYDYEVFYDKEGKPRAKTAEDI